MKINKQKIKRIVQFLIFIFIVWEIFITCTYLFRNTSGVLRRNVVGFYDEKEDSLDVVFVAGSNVYRYWDCMRAWDEHGFTSYNYSVSSMASATTISAIKEIHKTQDPQLVVVDVRRLLSRFIDTEINASVRNAFDAQDYNLNRLAEVEYFRKLNGISVKDTISEYIDLIEYHDNHDALSEKLNWQLVDNRPDYSMDADGFYKGFAIVAWHTFLEEPETEYTTETIELPEVSEQICVDIIEYCQEQDIELLLVASPYEMTETDKMEMNALKKLAEEYGVGFLDTNAYYDEMSLDFSTDFYNDLHVNLLGAEKYTDFLAWYIVDNYNLPDHREDMAYAHWNDMYAEYIVEKEKAQNETLEIIETRYSVLEMEEVMRETDQARDWLTMADNENIVVFTTMQQPCENELSYKDEELLRKYGLDSNTILQDSFIGVYNKGNLFSSNSDSSNSGAIWNVTNQFDYALSLEDGQLIVGEKQWSIPSVEGVQMMAYDKNIRQIVDSIVINVTEDGALTLEHLEY